MKTVTISKVDIPLLKKQKLALVGIAMSKDFHQLTTKQVNAIDGVINLLDHIQDEAAKPIEVDSLPNFEFWLGMFRPRTKKWQRDNLKRLRAKVSVFESADENADKIKALEFLLN